MNEPTVTQDFVGHQVIIWMNSGAIIRGRLVAIRPDLYIVKDEQNSAISRMFVSKEKVETIAIEVNK